MNAAHSASNRYIAGQHFGLAVSDVMAKDLRIRIVSSLGEVPAAAWDACANPVVPDPLTAVAPPSSRCPAGAARDGSTPAPGAAIPPVAIRVQETPYNPFVSHAFLNALETSKSATARTGWQPQHLVVETADGKAIGAAPCYLKSHSRGEYVFDAGWADAYENAGGDYYPKLQVSVPFTPATGRRLLVLPGPEAADIRAALAAGLVEVCRLRKASSVHVTFAPEGEWTMLGERGFLQRTDQQFRWQNAGYGSFEDFLAALAARKRKAIRRERRDALPAGIEVHWLTGSDLTESVWDHFFAFYMETGSRKWGRPYLTRDFYSQVGQAMGDRILLVMAKRAGRWIAGAINFIGSDTLFGRHWGAVEHHPFLHFELCYYQAIDFAIAHRLAFVEAGAQGEHKLARGYLPVTTRSAHYIVDAGFRRAVADYLARERAYVAAAGRELAEAAPFRKDFSAEED
jgi:predicted N-acyltransferase